MAKMLPNRMKPFLGGVISESQSAFLHGRLITDIIAGEIDWSFRSWEAVGEGWLGVGGGYGGFSLSVCCWHLVLGKDGRIQL
ncbi:unnamed protein product [Cuscuta campestris]|uniref:Reverse transcriptase domain-containing protein n=1 Tax=Cuscuta campestris TaxID=132261 RepID=A0A484NJA1_9ASTE|nr:unnamed protein product [Cuscuta campestris]VFR01070.1 unnamed protein product [Cuscuta campestris]